MLTTYPEFVAYCKTLHGETLHTLARSKPFTVVVTKGVLNFVPSTGAPRRADAKKTADVLRTLAESKEWSPGAYRGMTQHASYILAIAKRWSDRGGMPGTSR